MRTLLRPCYMPHPEGQCHPQTTTNLSAPCPRSVTSLPCPCPSSAGRGQGWDSSLSISLLSLMGSPQPQHCTVTGAHTLHFTTLPLRATHQTLGKPACMKESPNTTNPSCVTSLDKYITAGQDVKFPPCPTARCIRRASSFISALLRALLGGLAHLRTPVTEGLEMQRMIIFHPLHSFLLRDFRHGAELE